MPVNLNSVKGFDEFLEEQEGPTLMAANDPPFTTPTQDEYVNGQRVGERKKTIDNES